MITAIADVLPIAVVVAICPLAIITVIVLLLSDGGRLRATLFAVGWMLSLFAITAVAIAITDVVEEADPEITVDGVKIFSLILGILFLVMAVISFRGRPAPGEPAKEAKIFARVSGMPGAAVLVLGLAQGVLVVKNVPLSLGAGARIAADGQSGLAAYVVAAIYVVVASAAILVPILVTVIGGSRLDPALMSLRKWLEDNISPITIVTLVVVAAYFIAKGLLILS